MKWMYLSYAGDDGFHGACVVQGGDVVEAAAEARRLGISPGGQVLGVPVPDDVISRIPETDRNRVLSAAEARVVGEY